MSVQFDITPLVAKVAIANMYSLTSGMVDRLIEDGLVERVLVPANARRGVRQVSHLVPTAAGRELVAQAQRTDLTGTDDYIAGMWFALLSKPSSVDHRDGIGMFSMPIRGFGKGNRQFHVLACGVDLEASDAPTHDSLTVYDHDSFDSGASHSEIHMTAVATCRCGQVTNMKFDADVTDDLARFIRSACDFTIEY